MISEQWIGRDVGRIGRGQFEVLSRYLHGGTVKYHENPQCG
jgi:hypothetical protein